MNIKSKIVELPIYEGWKRKPMFSEWKLDSFDIQIMETEDFKCKTRRKNKIFFGIIKFRWSEWKHWDMIYAHKVDEVFQYALFFTKVGLLKRGINLFR